VLSRLLGESLPELLAELLRTLLAREGGIIKRCGKRESGVYDSM
jgi:hypothetical protein